MLTWTQTLRCVLLSLPTVQIEKYVVDYWKRQAEGDRNGLQEPSLQKCMGMMGDFMKEVDPAFDMVWKMYVKSRPSPPKDEGMRKENDSDEPFMSIGGERSHLCSGRRQGRGGRERGVLPIARTTSTSCQ